MCTERIFVRVRHSGNMCPVWVKFIEAFFTRASNLLDLLLIKRVASQLIWRVILDVRCDGASASHWTWRLLSCRLLLDNRGDIVMSKSLLAIAIQECIGLMMIMIFSSCRCILLLVMVGLIRCGTMKTGLIVYSRHLQWWILNFYRLCGGNCLIICLVLWLILLDEHVAITDIGISDD